MGSDLASFVNACLHGDCNSGGSFSFGATLTHIWLWIVSIGYILSVLGFFIIVYATVRLFELRKREAEYYSTLLVAPGEEGGGHPRWAHIQSLAGGGAAQCREAILEADILLEEVLTKAGYVGDGIGEKLKSADKLTFATLEDAWEAHKVRNQIAHEGSAFKLSESLAQRTLAHYEAVFREFKAI